MGGMARISRRVVLSAAPLVPFAPYLIRSSFGQHNGRGARLYVGTYTHDVGVAGKAEGIYSAEWDADKGVASSLQLAAKSADPSFLAIPPKRDALYAVNEGEDYPQPHGGKGGSVTAFRRDPASWQAHRAEHRALGRCRPLLHHGQSRRAGGICRELQQRYPRFVSHHAERAGRACHGLRRARQWPKHKNDKRGRIFTARCFRPTNGFCW